MTKPASITESEFRRLAKLAKATGVRVIYRRKGDEQTVEIVPEDERQVAEKEKIRL